MWQSLDINKNLKVSNILKILVINKIMSKYQFLKKILFNPFYYYWRMGGFTFSMVSFTNLSTTLLGIGNSSEYCRSLLKNNPDVYFAGLLAKSIYYGVIWPSFYITIFQKPNHAFILASYIKKNIKKIENKNI